MDKVAITHKIIDIFDLLRQNGALETPVKIGHQGYPLFNLKMNKGGAERWIGLFSATGFILAFSDKRIWGNGLDIFNELNA